MAGFERRIPVRSELDKRGIDLDSLLCPICNSEIETVDHVIVGCNFSKDIWAKVAGWWKVRLSPLSSVRDVFLQNSGDSFSTIKKEIWQATIWVTGYCIWNYRNNLVFKAKHSNTSAVLSEIQLLSHKWIIRRWRKGVISWLRWMLDPG